MIGRGAVVVLTLGVLATATQAQDNNPCVDFFTASQKDVRTLDSYTSAFASTYNQLCKNSSQSTSLSASANFIIEKIPIGLDGKSDQQKIVAFCSYGATQNWSTDKLTTRDESVVRESLQAFNSCMAIRDRKVMVSYAYSEPSGLVVKFDNPDSNANVGFFGVQTDPRGKLSCTLNRPDEQPLDLTSKTKSFSLLGVTFTVSCTRKPIENSHNRTVYARESIILTTNISNSPPLPIVMPGYVRLGEIEESQKDSEIRRLQTELNEARTRLDAEIGRLTPVRAKSYIITSMLNFPVPLPFVSYVRDLRSPDLEPAARCGGGYPWGNHVAPAAKKLCERDGLVFNGDIVQIFTAGSGGCGRGAFMVTCANR